MMKFLVVVKVKDHAVHRARGVIMKSLCTVNDFLNVYARREMR